jgi:hypothetical protein
MRFSFATSPARERLQPLLLQLDRLEPLLNNLIAIVLLLQW